MGGHYARLEGLPAEVADAIEDHYKPLGASEEMPRGDLGALVGLADRLHQLVGIIGVGEKATGAADPFGLRRAAIGILRILLDRGYHLSLRAAVEATLDTLGRRQAGRRAPRRWPTRCVEFVRGRLKALWGEEVDGDLVEAVLAAGFDDVVDARQRLQALAVVKKRDDFLPLAVAFKRVANIQEKAPAGAARAGRPGAAHRAGRAGAARRGGAGGGRGGRGRGRGATTRPSCGRWPRSSRRWTPSSTASWSWPRTRRCGPTGWR